MKKLILLFSLTLLVSCASNTEQEVQKEKMQEKNKHIHACLAYFFNSNPRYEQIIVSDDYDKPLYWLWHTVTHVKRGKHVRLFAEKSKNI